MECAKKKKKGCHVAGGDWDSEGCSMDWTNGVVGKMCFAWLIMVIGTRGHNAEEQCMVMMLLLVVSGFGGMF
jgi:hypothetical protein